MDKLEQFEAILKRIDDGTNEVAKDLREIREQLKGSGLPGSTEDMILAKLEAAALKLEAVGKDPVPEPAPVPPPPTA